MFCIILLGIILITNTPHERKRSTQKTSVKCKRNSTNETVNFEQSTRNVSQLTKFRLELNYVTITYVIIILTSCDHESNQYINDCVFAMYISIYFLYNDIIFHT